MTVPIKHIITNLCSEGPLPPLGSMVAPTTILDSVIHLWSPPHNISSAWVSLLFAHWFSFIYSTTRHTHKLGFNTLGNAAASVPAHHTLHAHLMQCKGWNRSDLLGIAYALMLSRDQNANGHTFEKIGVLINLYCFKMIYADIFSTSNSKLN